MTDVSLPPGITLGERAGEGRRSVVYRGQFNGRAVAVKIYRPEFIEKYRQRYGVCIAAFEWQRNRAVFDTPGLRPYAAEPLTVIDDARHGLAFVQEFIDGESLVELGRRQGELPDSVLRAGDEILREADRAGLHDLDLYYRNILVRERDGKWLPVLHDFNLMPQYRYPPNPFLWLAYRSGIRKKSHRDRRCIAQWHAYSRQCRSSRAGTVSR